MRDSRQTKSKRKQLRNFCDGKRVYGFIYLSLDAHHVHRQFLLLSTPLITTLHIPSKTCRIASESSGKISNQNPPIGPRPSFGAEYSIFHWKIAHTTSVPQLTFGVDFVPLGDWRNWQSVRAWMENKSMHSDWGSNESANLYCDVDALTAARGLASVCLGNRNCAAVLSVASELIR